MENLELKDEIQEFRLPGTTLGAVLGVTTRVDRDSAALFAGVLRSLCDEDSDFVVSFGTCEESPFG